MAVLPVAQLELAAAEHPLHRHTRLGQPADVLGATGGVEDLDDLVAGLDALLQERDQDFELFVRPLEKRTDVAAFFDQRLS
jgi:hypothetical protein